MTLIMMLEVSIFPPIIASTCISCRAAVGTLCGPWLQSLCTVFLAHASPSSIWVSEDRKAAQ